MTIHISEIGVRLAIGPANPAAIRQTAGTPAPGAAHGQAESRALPTDWLDQCVERSAQRVIELLRAREAR